MEEGKGPFQTNCLSRRSICELRRKDHSSIREPPIGPRSSDVPLTSDFSPEQSIPSSGLRKCCWNICILQPRSLGSWSQSVFTLAWCLFCLHFDIQVLMGSRRTGVCGRPVLQNHKPPLLGRESRWPRLARWTSCLPGRSNNQAGSSRTGFRPPTAVGPH